ncbi:hypothetical protein [Azohydromonas australica]|uniref:hypothetical protein n=1 Tax=Azohydromonas australica TaxID=364039 RepID=UPI000426D2C1|nr:hypothetical protein [Azohydromonas australica]
MEQADELRVELDVLEFRMVLLKRMVEDQRQKGIAEAALAERIASMLPGYGW